jgi:hypothetical protein
MLPPSCLAGIALTLAAPPPGAGPARPCGREIVVVTENAYPPLQFLDMPTAGGGLGI